MDPSKRSELERLFSASADEGASLEQIEELEALLIDQPELQDHFLKMVAVHVLLDSEVRKNDQKEAIQPNSVSQESDTCCGLPPNQEPVPSSVVVGSRQRESRRAVWQAMAVAASLAFVFWCGRMTGDHDSTVANTQVPISIQDHRVQQGGLAIQNSDSLRLLGELTRDTGVTSVLLPHRNLASQSQITLCSGRAWYERPSRKKEQGYLVSLRPGERLDAYIDTDAMGRNSLSIAEIDASGYLTGKTMQFNNLPSGVTKVQTARAGAVGELSEYNDTPYTKYYLFAGSHMLYDDEEQEFWRQSIFEVQLDRNGLLVLGWDDSGYFGLVKEDGEESPPDRDYNDIRAMLRISAPDYQGEGITYYPGGFEPKEYLEGETEGFAFELGSQEQAVLAVYSDAKWQNAMRVIDTDTGQVIWSDDGPPATDGVRSDRDRGVYLIENGTDSPHHYLIQGRHRPGNKGPDAPWVFNEMRVLAKDNKVAVVGFNDSQTTGALDQWDDIRVFIRKFKD